MPALSELVYKSSDQVIPTPLSPQQHHISIVNNLCAVTWQLLACVGVKLVFILVTHTNRTGKRNVPGGAGSCFRTSCQFTWGGVTSPKKTNKMPFQPHPPNLFLFLLLSSTVHLITAVATQNFLGKARKDLLSLRTSLHLPSLSDTKRP